MDEQAKVIFVSVFISLCGNKYIYINRVFHSLYKVGRNGNFVFKGFNNSKKKVTSSGARPDATDYYWFRSPVPNQMS